MGFLLNGFFLSKKPGVIAQKFLKKGDPLLEVEGITAREEGGFIELVPQDPEFLAEEVLKHTERIEAYFEAKKTIREGHVLVDYCGVNIGKPFHFGHIRSCIVGDVIRRVCIANGLNTLSDVHLGDNMFLFACIMEGIKRMGLSIFDLDLGGIRKAYSKIQEEIKEDEGLMLKIKATALELQGQKTTKEFRHVREKSVQYIQKILDVLGSKIDIWDGEQKSYQFCGFIVEEGLKRGVFKKKDGAVVFDGLGNDFVVLRSNGTFLYSTTDIATLYERAFLNKASHIIYVVDQRQKEHFDNVFEIARRMQFCEKTKLSFVGFGAVLGKDKRPLKTRGKLEGVDVAGDLGEIFQVTSDDADESFINLVLRGHETQHNVYKDYVWNPEKAMDIRGKTGLYINYTYSRLCSVLDKRKEGREELSSEDINEIVAMMAKLEQCLELSLKTFVVGSVFNLLYDLCLKFNSVYNKRIILVEAGKKTFFILLTLKQVIFVLSKTLGLKLKRFFLIKP